MDGTLARGGAIAMVLLLSAFLAMLVAPPAGAVIALREVPPGISSVEGAVEISPDDGNSWETARAGGHVSAGDLLRTGSDGACVLAFSDHTVVVLQALTTVTMLPADRTQRFLLSAGRVRVQFDSVSPGDRDSVTTPRLTVAATEPCTFVLESDENGAVVKVLDGQVHLSSDTGTYVSSLGAGEALIAAKDAYSLPTGFDATAEQAKWDGFLAGTTTTSIPGETTTTSSARTTSTSAGATGSFGTLPPGDGPGSGDSGTNAWTRWGIVLVVVAAVLFVALIALATVLLVVLSRRRPPRLPSVEAQQPGHEPPAFCRHCGAPFAARARFCRACGKPN